jgi:hypothetical protein
VSIKTTITDGVRSDLSAEVVKRVGRNGVVVFTYPFEPEGDYNPELLFRYLDSNGDGTGDKNVVGNYSTDASSFYIQPPPNTEYHIERLIVAIRDGAGFRAERYAGLGAALTNGIDIQKRDTGGRILYSFLDGVPIRTNGDWGRLCYDVDLKTWGAGDDFLLVRFTIGKSGGHLHLDGSKNENLAITLNDDFTALNDHFFLVQGYVISED